MGYDFDYSGELVLLDERVERFVDYAFAALPWLEGTERTVGDILKAAFDADEVLEQPTEAIQGRGAATVYQVYGCTRGDRPEALLAVFARYGVGTVDCCGEDNSLWRWLLSGRVLHTADAVVTYPDLDGVTTEVVPDLDDLPVLA